MVYVDMLIDAILTKTLELQGITPMKMALQIGLDKYEKTAIKNYFRFTSLISEKIASMRNDFKSCIMQ